MSKIGLVNPQLVTSKFHAPLGFPDDTLIRHSLAFLSSSFFGETPRLDNIPFEDRQLRNDYRERTKFPIFVTG